jgi:hypothetical protein
LARRLIIVIDKNKKFHERTGPMAGGLAARKHAERCAPAMRASLLPRRPSPSSLAFSLSMSLFVLLAAALVLANSRAVQAQDAGPGVVGLGDLIVSGASGTVAPPDKPPLPPGTNALDETFIDLNGASINVFDVSTPEGPAAAQLLNAPAKFQVFARDVGQVFGLAVDDAQPANIYAASTSVHGLHIVVPDADGDGRPERIKLGQPGAVWMDGLFGVGAGGGPRTGW